MLEPDFRRNSGDDLPEPRHFQIFYFPGLQHLRTKFLADESEFPIAKIDRIEMKVGKFHAQGVVWRREVVNQVKNVCQVAPKNFFFESRKAEGVIGTLLRLASVIAGLQRVASQLFAESLYAPGGQIKAQEFDRIGVR